MAVVSPSFYPMIGGVESYVMGMGRELVELGFDITVYTPDRVLGRDCGPHDDIIAGIRVKRIKVPVDLSYRIKFWPGLHDALLGGGHDIIHVYSHDSYTLFAMLAARKMSVPFAVTTYGPFETHSDYNNIKASLLRLYEATVTPRIMRGSSAIFIRYPALAPWIESIGVAAGRIHLEPSGIPKESLDQRSSHKSEDGADAGPVILYLGRISPQKGVAHAVRSMPTITKEYPKSKLVLIGPDYTGYGRYLKALARELNVKGNVVINSPISDETEQLQAIADCDVFIMPSSFEGFSQSVMKAMAQGKPVVVTNVGGLPYEVDFGRCGVVCEYGDSEGLARCIMDLLKGREHSMALAKNGRERARKFTFDVLATNLAEQYTRLAN